MLFIANWKMAMTSVDIAHFFTDAKTVLNHVEFAQPAHCVICPSFPYLVEVKRWLMRVQPGWQLGAQNISFTEEHAMTGEVSPSMLKDFETTYVCIGHSERRQHCYESNDIVQKKLRLCLDHQLTPVLCVGETLHENQQGKSVDVVLEQLRSALPAQLDQPICIAYEPIWAIGSGLSAQPEDVQNLLEIIDEWVQDRYPDSHQTVKYLYGGSVSTSNAVTFCAQPRVNGLLIGGASLEAVSLIEIMRLCTQSSSQYM